jgi:microsomal dipeptidase-like Zn-dependent dipeptidase
MRGTIRNITLIVVLLTIALVNPGLNTSSPVAGLPLGPAVVEAQDPPPPAPVWGIADTHNHQFANLGFGGLMIWGDVFRWDDDIAKALPWSDFMPGRYGDVLNYHGYSREYDVAAPELGYPNIPATCPPGTGTSDNPCRGFAIHGPGGLRDLLNIFMSGRLGHLVGGYPQFDGYPRWSTYTGQTMYYQWLKRAWEQGGLRLLVMFAVNNEAICSVIDRKAGFTCEDMPAIDRQIQAAKDLERFIDLQNDGQNDGDGWYRIAYSPQQARQIINDGKLAVVLGIETPSLFGCKVNSDCTDEYVLTEIKRYRDMGVRHIYPLHNADNGFGGTGLYNDIFGLNTRVINGEWFDITNDCDPRIDFHMDLLDGLQPGTDPIHDMLIQLLRELLGSNAVPPRPPAGANCNARGLQPLGTTLINGLMDERMIIDVDHLSERTFNDVMAIAETRQYAGVISSHNAYVELGIPRGDSHSIRHEANILPEELERIRALGGNVSVIIHQPDRSAMQALHLRRLLRSMGPGLPVCRGPHARKGGRARH